MSSVISCDNDGFVEEFLYEGVSYTPKSVRNRSALVPPDILNWWNEVLRLEDINKEKYCARYRSRKGWMVRLELVPQTRYVH